MPQAILLFTILGVLGGLIHRRPLEALAGTATMGTLLVAAATTILAGGGAVPISLLVLAPFILGAAATAGVTAALVPWLEPQRPAAA